MNAMPPGWYPDRTNAAQLRWWNGTSWTDQVQPAQGPQFPVPSPSDRPEVQAASTGWGQAQPTPLASPTSDAGSKGGVAWMKRHKVLTGIGAFALVGVMSNAFGGETEPSTDKTADVSAQVADSVPQDESASEAVEDEAVEEAAEESPKSEKPEPKPSNPYGPQPPQQMQFVALANTAMEEYAAASNDLKAGAALGARNEAMCNLLGSGQIAGWAGTVTTLDSNGDGYGVLTIEIAPNIEIATWNNAISDIMDETLIKPGSLLNKLLELEEGDNVKFAGQFRSGGDTCVNDSRLTQAGSVDDPSFIFRFADVNPVG